MASTEALAAGVTKYSSDAIGADIAFSPRRANAKKLLFVEAIERLELGKLSRR
jgi:hypothetical protein